MLSDNSSDRVAHAVTTAFVLLCLRLCFGLGQMDPTNEAIRQQVGFRKTPTGISGT